VKLLSRSKPPIKVNPKNNHTRNKNIILKPACNGRLFSIGIYFNQPGFGKEIGKESSWISLTNYKLI